MQKTLTGQDYEQVHRCCHQLRVQLRLLEQSMRSGELRLLQLGTQPEAKCWLQVTIGELRRRSNRFIQLLGQLQQSAASVPVQSDLGRLSTDECRYFHLRWQTQLQPRLVSLHQKCVQQLNKSTQPVQSQPTSTVQPDSSSGRPVELNFTSKSSGRSGGESPPPGELKLDLSTGLWAESHTALDRLEQSMRENARLMGCIRAHVAEGRYYASAVFTSGQRSLHSIQHAGRQVFWAKSIQSSGRRLKVLLLAGAGILAAMAGMYLLLLASGLQLGILVAGRQVIWPLIESITQVTLKLYASIDRQVRHAYPKVIDFFQSFSNRSN